MALRTRCRLDNGLGVEVLEHCPIPQSYRLLLRYISFGLRKNDGSPLCADVSWRTGLDLSEATKLQNVVFRCMGQNVKWISKALHTARSGNLQHISLELPRRCRAVRDVTWETVHQEWAELDHLLVEFCASRLLRPKVIYEPGKLGEEMRDRATRLLPELARRGIIDLVQCPR